MSLGLSQHKVSVHVYDPEWPRLYAEEASRLQDSLGEWILAIEHVGITSIPGLDSKPIIDIGIAIQDFEAAFDCVPLMAELGYHFRGEQGVPGRHFYILGRPRTHHVHMSEIASEDWKDRLAFRNHLRTHPGAVAEYQALKHSLALEFPTDISSYSLGKKDFIERIISSQSRLTT